MPLLDSSGQILDTKIALVTRLGQDIDNVQSWQLTVLDWNPINENSIKAYGRARQLSDACPVCNCHGLTFGSRRTAVTHDVRPILEQDGFTEIAESKAQEGDVVAYFEDGEITHTGFLIGREPLFVGNATALRIWSKWARGAEMSHLLQDCPYFKGDDNVRFYRLTEWRDAWRKTA